MLSKTSEITAIGVKKMATKHTLNCLDLDTVFVMLRLHHKIIDKEIHHAILFVFCFSVYVQIKCVAESGFHSEFLVQVQLRTEVLRTLSSTRPGFELMTSRS